MAVTIESIDLTLKQQVERAIDRSLQEKDFTATKETFINEMNKFPSTKAMLATPMTTQAIRSITAKDIEKSGGWAKYIKAFRFYRQLSSSTR